MRIKVPEARGLQKNSEEQVQMCIEIQQGWASKEAQARSDLLQRSLLAPLGSCWKRDETVKR